MASHNEIEMVKTEMVGTVVEKPSNGNSIDDELGAPNTHDKNHTVHDEQNMSRMGRKQELIRNYRPLSAFSFTVILQATWEFLLISNTQGLTDGGLAGLFWTYTWTFVGFGIVMVSLAEMASMAPISGGQYHWVSEFAPPQYQKFLSYITGWMSTLAWQAGTASGSFLTGTIIQGLIGVNNPDYEAEPYQGTLFVFAMVLVLYLFNVFASKQMPMMQNFLLVIHTLAFFVIIIVLWVMAPKQSASAVFTQFTNEGGWSTTGVALMIGQISAIYGSLASDATAHMSEEVKDAGVNVPRAMVWSYVGNGIIGFILLITYLFSIPSVDDALNDPSGFPFIYVFSNAVNIAGVNALTIIVLILVIFSNVSFNASTSRQTFAFARDKGLPFYSWIAKVHPTKEIPANAVIFSCVLSALLSLINIGSTAAFNAIISLQVVAIMFTYSVSISCVLYRRLWQPELLPPARWSLGRWGPLINGLGLAYVLFAFFWSFWPNATPVDLESMNWCVVMFVGVAIFALIMYVVRGRHIYIGPVELIEARKRQSF